ncbi:MAG: hypothetical protein KatS3mg108_0202 [Isosphaeraceae bacterium]|nr:MAG: hypothetical protein KatS3mg108_0202 [Isosphaeraceae bacterium]
MADDTPPALLFIVVGTTLRAEEGDRPLAYYLKDRIENALTERGPLDPVWRVCVIADVRWLHEEALQGRPTISLGGPGVNMVAHQWFSELPDSLIVDQRIFVQMDPELTDLRASVWGMDNADTQVAVEVFVRRFLPRFLDQCIEHATELPDYDPHPDDADDEDEA